MNIKITTTKTMGDIQTSEITEIDGEEGEVLTALEEMGFSVHVQDDIQSETIH